MTGAMHWIAQRFTKDRQGSSRIYAWRGIANILMSRVLTRHLNVKGSSRFQAWGNSAFRIPNSDFTPLGWEPARSFEKGLQETVTWYIKHEDLVKNVVSGEYREYYQKMYEEKE